MKNITVVYSHKEKHRIKYTKTDGNLKNLFQSISVCNDKSCAWFKVALEHLLEQLREFKLVQVLHLEFNTFLREAEIEQMCKIKIHCKEKET